jgi:hypothetical protein
MNRLLGRTGNWYVHVNACVFDESECGSKMLSGAVVQMVQTYDCGLVNSSKPCNIPEVDGVVPM